VVARRLAGRTPHRRPTFPAPPARRSVGTTGATGGRPRRNATARLPRPRAHLAPPGRRRRRLATLHRSAGRLRGPQLLVASRRQSLGAAARRLAMAATRADYLRRLDTEHAGGAPARTRLVLAQSHRQAAPDRARAAARTAPLETRDSGNLPDVCTHGRRRRGCRSGQPCLLRQSRPTPERIRSGIAHRAAASPFATAPRPLPGSCPAGARQGPRSPAIALGRGGDRRRPSGTGDRAKHPRAAPRAAARRTPAATAATGRAHRQHHRREPAAVGRIPACGQAAAAAATRIDGSTGGR
jgi:hypothetical protein